eukprot:CAMPEP_0184687654 /NCGR_PEP_ID=MMETSP0312-20130426/27213_1 /TAXON_ID=31354 /ORGANISM="Compsopogon coeruleus, Strain SAG 36.94" /LENGTH=461 /DNA_ID=CAMNT_0027144027 /DNA_START=148 /DNA_END=1530 /DNA_ORIENTATION=+
MLHRSWIIIFTSCLILISLSFWTSQRYAWSAWNHFEENLVISDLTESNCDGWLKPTVRELGPAPKPPQGTKILFEEEDFVFNASWFTPERRCRESCCAQQYLLPAEKEKRALMCEISMKEIAEVRYGREGKAPFNPRMERGKYLTPVLTEKIAPCLQPGVSIKVERNDTSWFFDYMDPLIQVPYVIISGGGYGGDWPTPVLQEKQYISYRNLLHWFTIHPTEIHNGKLTQVPLGVDPFSSYRHDIERILEARSYENPFSLHRRNCFRKKANMDGPKNNGSDFDTLISFKPRSNPDQREPAWRLFCGSKPAEVSPVYVRHPDEESFAKCMYYGKSNLHSLFLDLDQATFGLSPRGMGYDCHRNWELLAMGVIPIVTRFRSFDTIFDDLPILILEEEWKNLTPARLRFLQQAYLDSDAFKTSSFNGWNKLFNAYWRSRVLQAGGRSAESRQNPITGENYHLLW